MRRDITFTIQDFELACEARSDMISKRHFLALIIDEIAGDLRFNTCTANLLYR